MAKLFSESVNSESVSNNELAQLESVFKLFQCHSLKQDLIKLGCIKKIEKMNSQLSIQLVMPFLWNADFIQLKKQLSEQLCKLTNTNSITWEINYHIATLKRANNLPATKGVKNIIAISSAKGGVGKSTTCVNLAFALQQQGARVGILDADIYGPSIPHMLGASNQQPASENNQFMHPIHINNIFANSIGFLVDADNATIWRGPMASNVLIQLLQETLWPNLDYLIIDMPPGTGDIQLTLAQKIPVTGAIIVTTPQDIALLDAIKGISMFNKVAIPVIGIIENMSLHICSHCGHQEHIFGHGGAEKIVQKYDTTLLGAIPLDSRLREDLDVGVATVVANPEHQISQHYLQLAENLSQQLYWQGAVIADDIMFREIK